VVPPVFWVPPEPLEPPEPLSPPLPLSGVPPPPDELLQPMANAPNISAIPSAVEQVADFRRITIDMEFPLWDDHPGRPVQRVIAGCTIGPYDGSVQSFR
jgi:hypothetical protein